jgi:hypothetical protein
MLTLHKKGPLSILAIFQVKTKKMVCTIYDVRYFFQEKRRGNFTLLRCNISSNCKADVGVKMI